MGSVFGRISEETPKFQVVSRHATFEVRRGDTVCTTGRMTFASALPPFAEA